MANVDLKSSNADAWSGYFYYTYTQDIPNNRSYVDIKVWAQKEDGYSSGTNSGKYTASITVAGTTKTLSSGGGYALSPSGTWIGSDVDNDTASFTVYHDNDGSVTCDVSITVTPPSGLALSGNTLKYTGTITLPTIPRASSISAADNVYLGSICKISWTPLSTYFYYKLKFSMGSWTYTTSAIAPRTTVLYTYDDYTIPLEVAKQIPNTISGTMSVVLYSYNDSSCSTQIGSTSSATFTVTIPDSVVPSISSCTVSINNTANSKVASWGIALAGYSKVNIVASAAGAYGSTITGFNITGSYVASVVGDSLNYTGGIITSSGNKQFIITCTDSRGRVSESYTSSVINFIAYTEPKVKSLKMAKNTYGDENAANDRMVATATWEFDSIGGRNSATAKVYYKITSAADWTAHSGTLTNGSAFTLTDLVPDELSSYNFKVVVTDALGKSDEKDAFSSTITVLLDFRAGGDGLGVGKICEEPGMEVAMDATFYNEIFIKNKQQTLEDYIRSLMKVLSSDMYGSTLPSSGTQGQLFFKKVSS